MRDPCPCPGGLKGRAPSLWRARPPRRARAARAGPSLLGAGAARDTAGAVEFAAAEQLAPPRSASESRAPALPPPAPPLVSIPHDSRGEGMGAAGLRGAGSPSRGQRELQGLHRSSRPIKEEEEEKYSLKTRSGICAGTLGARGPRPFPQERASRRSRICWACEPGPSGALTDAMEPSRSSQCPRTTWSLSTRKVWRSENLPRSGMLRSAP